jgi:biopolymer transport protein ExbD
VNSRQGARRIRPATAAFAQAEINVTPLVDVVLVLLIIFMVVAPLVGKTLDVRVPAVVSADPRPSSPTTPQIVVYLGEDGTTRIGNRSIDPATIRVILRQELEPRGAADRIVFVAADDRASYGALVALMDQAKRAGAEVLAMAPYAPP